MESSPRNDAHEPVENCEKHGAFVSRPMWKGAIHRTKCPACTAEWDAAAAAREAERRREAEMQQAATLLERRLRLSGLEPRTLDASFDNFTTAKPGQAEVLSVCQTFVAGFNPDKSDGLWLIGPPGTGKTHLGAAMVSTVIRQHLRFACIASGQKIIRAVRDTWNGKTSYLIDPWGQDGPKDAEEVIEHFGTAPLLVLDEVGVGFGSEAEKVQLLAVIDRRYEKCRPTVLLSNLVAADLKTVLGDRAFDRLRQGARPVLCRWNSMRGSGG